MLYVARYGEDAVDAAMKAAQQMVRDDGYYAMYGGGGTGLVHRGSYRGLWDDVVRIDGFGTVDAEDLEKVVLPAEWFLGRTVGWTTCAGNYAGFEFDSGRTRISTRPAGVTLTMRGARHGIPWYAHVLADFEPVEVLQYESWRTDVSPFAVGLLPPDERIPEVAGNAIALLREEGWDGEVTPENLPEAKEKLEEVTGSSFLGRVLEKHLS